ncbi:hypothetical protein NC653_016020 [Populus alba x Populus x berolinensis]|uniref:Uncharacterized protein n=1 Tax=Populus alba x Populus x berolinensis TaxID=444605 RepID=A0AAD6VYR2_9ROSI|nr:hypothetical protein NC653_016020 [Populus alba x Populus x berolinensis]
MAHHQYCFLVLGVFSLPFPFPSPKSDVYLGLHLSEAFVGQRGKAYLSRVASKDESLGLGLGSYAEDWSVM